MKPWKVMTCAGLAVGCVACAPLLGNVLATLAAFAAGLTALFYIALHYVE